MEKFIEVNENWMFSDEHFVLTERGLLIANELLIGDNIIGAEGVSTIMSIKECGKRPDAPVVGKK